MLVNVVEKQTAHFITNTVRSIRIECEKVPDPFLRINDVYPETE